MTRDRPQLCVAFRSETDISTVRVAALRVKANYSTQFALVCLILCSVHSSNYTFEYIMTIRKG
jgi:hypothetical protein